MKNVLLGAVLGSVVGAMLCAVAFVLGALGDGTGLIEALGYSLIVAILGMFLGAIIGAAVFIANLHPFGGALVGLLVALAVAGFYVVTFSRSGQVGHFLSEARVLIVGLTVPLTLTGSLTAWIKKFLLTKT